MNDIEDIARAMVARGKGLLAADESHGTIGKRFATIGLANDEANRRSYRTMLFSTKKAISSCISGVILFDETIRQTDNEGIRFVDILTKAGAIVGIKVDKGAKQLAGFSGETVTEGLDGLRERLQEYHQLGARFAKWRATILIGAGNPSGYAIMANAHALARYGALCQESGLVPIIEPEVLMDGDHTIERCGEVTEAVLREVYRQAYLHKLCLEGTILKPNMVLPGSACRQKASAEQVAECTVRVLRRCVPVAVPGIAFLSGGQTEVEATAHLSAMNAGYSVPWRLSFSYGRALQTSALSCWGGLGDNVAAGQSAFAHRANMNSLAVCGQWDTQLETPAA